MVERGAASTIKDRRAAAATVCAPYRTGAAEWDTSQSAAPWSPLDIRCPRVRLVRERSRRTGVNSGGVSAWCGRCKDEQNIGAARGRRDGSDGGLCRADICFTSMSELRGGSAYTCLALALRISCAIIPSSVCFLVFLFSHATRSRIHGTC